MSESRRLVTLVSLVVAVIVSLLLVSSVRAAAPPVGPPAPSAPQVSAQGKRAHDRWLDECRANGGTWIEEPDPDNLGWRVGSCTWTECELKWRKIGSIQIPYKSCELKPEGYAWK